MFFLTDSNLFYITLTRKKGFSFGLFGLGQKYQGRTVLSFSLTFPLKSAFISTFSNNFMKMAKRTINLETDYLIVGGGAMCMAFVDEILYGSRTFGNIFIRF